MKKKLIVLISILVLGLLGSFNLVFSQTEKIQGHFFFTATCPYCAEEKKFLDRLEAEHSELEIKRLLLPEKENLELLLNLYQDYQVLEEDQGFVPILFIGERYFLSFDQKTANNIENYILGLIGKIPNEPTEPEDSSKDEISLPIIGEIDISNLSLPALAVVLGFFDGFNVCSLGALVLILGLVLALRSKSKTLILGGIFILTTGIIYGVLIYLWHQLFVALSPYIRKMEIVIGALALIGGLYFLREFLKFRERGPACEFGGISQKLSERIQKIFEKRANILALIGVIFLFAAVITIIEFPCSAVLPVLFAGMLCKANLPAFTCSLYTAIFVFFYMLDEIVIFLISVFTMKLWITSPKFVTLLNLLAAVMLFGLGIYYLVGLV